MLSLLISRPKQPSSPVLFSPCLSSLQTAGKNRIAVTQEPENLWHHTASWLTLKQRNWQQQQAHTCVGATFCPPEKQLQTVTELFFSPKKHSRKSITWIQFNNNLLLKSPSWSLRNVALLRGALALNLHPPALAYVRVVVN